MALSGPLPPIRFYSHNSEGAQLSNYAPFALVIDGKSYATPEHYFQSVKFAETAPEHAEKIRLAKTPGIAKSIGNTRKYPIAAGWDTKRDDVMRRIIACKIEQHPEFAKFLKSTAPRELMEDSPSDYYWGIGSKGTGRNRLGALLMEARERIQ